MQDESDLVRKEIDQIQREQPEIKRKINLYAEALMKSRAASESSCTLCDLLQKQIVYREVNRTTDIENRIMDYTQFSFTEYTIISYQKGTVSFT